MGAKSEGKHGRTTQARLSGRALRTHFGNGVCRNNEETFSFNSNHLGWCPLCAGDTGQRHRGHRTASLRTQDSVTEPAEAL